jgi:quercetin dioxygenase-like cupin family protein
VLVRLGQEVQEVPRGLISKMPEAGQEVEGFGGMRLRFVRVDADFLEMEASYTGEAGMPPEHLHPRQIERFEILEGSMRAIVDGEERVYEVGESFEVPAGTPHQMAAEGPTRMRWKVTPALRTAEFFVRLHGRGPDSAREMGEAFLPEFTEEFRLT